MKKSSINGAAKEKKTYEFNSTAISNGSKARGCSWEDSSASCSASFEVPESSSSICLFLPSREVAEGGTKYVWDESEMCVKPALFLDEPALFQIPRVHSHEPKLPGNHQQQWSIRALPHLRNRGKGGD
jgi:hypothetical protein